ncbi:MAG TPA: GNAT family N-acetyltransferase [Solirubrobacterales bacterium]|nr:GNAT family N-acetyltransferase [Solirubrobacterales bacterium]
MATLRGPRPLERKDPRDGFSCGVHSLDTWLVEHAPVADAVGSARTYVILDEEQDRVVGYYALTVASLEREEATGRASRGMPRHPIPAMLLARLAVDESVQGEGAGATLLADAMQRTLLVAEEIGIRLLLVHAVNEEARGFYLHFGFEASPSDPMNLQLLIKDIRATIEVPADESTVGPTPSA